GRAIVGTILGGIPGMVLFAFVSQRVGIATAVLGALVGAVIGIADLSVRRVCRLLFAIIVNYNLPGMDRLFDWVDDGTTISSESKTLSEAVNDWLAAKDVEDRRCRIVMMGLVVGLLCGAGVSIFDAVQLMGDRQGILLPFDNSPDSLIVQSVLLSLACAIWFGAATGVLATPAFRRPILSAIVIASVLSGMIGFAAHDGRGPGPLEFVTVFSTVAAAGAIFLAANLE
ncbi:MAG: hypothetical protein KDA84_29485, partial [Planctomycetaceae bacterium]|nr:hypothetical protein [Planctomycetaceae bacterium]